MSREFARTKPQGYSNYVESVAIVGAGGQVGRYIVEELVKSDKHKITAITRGESTFEAPAGVVVKRVNYDDDNSLVEALQGQQVLIITMGTTAPPDQQTKLLEAAAAANVPYVLPNEWGGDGTNDQLNKDTMLGARNAEYRAQIEKLGKSSWIGFACSFWYEYSLSGGVDRYGFDLKNRTVNFIDDGTTRINTSTWPQTGRGVAGLLGLKILPDDENDRSPCLSHFRNKYVFVSSFLVSQKEMLDSVMRVTGTTIKDWKVTHENHKDRYNSGKELLQSGNMLGFVKCLYTRIFYPDGSGDYETSQGLHNGILGLPKEDLDERTKVALQMAQ